MKRIKRLLFCAVVSCLMAMTVVAAEAKAPAKATTLENLQAGYNGESKLICSIFTSCRQPCDQAPRKHVPAATAAVLLKQ